MRHKNIMLDLETMSTKSNAAITAIGAVYMDFDDCVLGGKFYQSVDLVSSVDNGGHLCPETVLWWFKQSDEARHILTENTESLSVTLIKFQNWLESYGPKDNLCIWGNGVAFDNVILRNSYERMGWACPWTYRGDMCYRTERTLHREVRFKKSGTAHNALDDAGNQALHLIEIMKRKRQPE